MTTPSPFVAMAAILTGRADRRERKQESGRARANARRSREAIRSARRLLEKHGYRVEPPPESGR